MLLRDGNGVETKVQNFQFWLVGLSSQKMVVTTYSMLFPYIPLELQSARENIPSRKKNKH